MTKGYLEREREPMVLSLGTSTDMGRGYVVGFYFSYGYSKYSDISLEQTM